MYVIATTVRKNSVMSYPPIKNDKSWPFVITSRKIQSKKNFHPEISGKL